MPEIRHDVSFFRPGQLIFHVAGEANTQSLINWAAPIAEKQGAKISVGKPITFPPPEYSDRTKQAFRNRYLSKTGPGKAPVAGVQQGPFALVPATVEGFKKEEEKEKLLDLVLELDQQRKTHEGNKIEVVALNWFMTGGASSPGGTGGPGGRPTDFTGQIDTQEHHFHFDSFKEEDQKLFLNGNQGDGVVVAVLDTAPTDLKTNQTLTVDQIYDTWVNHRNPKHSLLESMQRNNALGITPDPSLNRPSPDVISDPPGFPPGFIQAEDHDYNMQDHGLFIAGIIHSLAPKAKIQIIQVLNMFGCSDLENIALGLEKVVAFQQGHPTQNLLVNMSLTMQFPLEEAHIETDDPKVRELGMQILRQKPSGLMQLICTFLNWLSSILNIPWLACEPSWFDRQSQPLLSIIRSVSTLQSDIIAAAGNKGKNGYRPQAEFPAAFAEVLGVGALPKNQDPKPDPRIRMRTAVYSNLSDRPKYVGKAAFGGEEKGEDGIEKGILGIYTGEFPRSKPGIVPPKSAKASVNGWGYWSGTSFATGVVTGLVANMLSNMPGKTPRDAINALSEAQEYLTDQCEDVLYVTQC